MSGTRAGSVSVQQFIVRTAAAPLPSLSGSSAQHCTVGCLVAGGYGHFLVCSFAVWCLSTTDTLTIYLHSPASTYLLHLPISIYLHSPISISISTVHSITLNLPKHVKCKERLIQNLMPPKVKSQFPTAVKERERMIHLHNSAWLKFCFYD